MEPIPSVVDMQDLAKAQEHVFTLVNSDMEIWKLLEAMPLHLEAYHKSIAIALRFNDMDLPDKTMCEWACHLWALLSVAHANDWDKENRTFFHLELVFDFLLEVFPPLCEQTALHLQKESYVYRYVFDLYEKVTRVNWLESDLRAMLRFADFSMQPGCTSEGHMQHYREFCWRLLKNVEFLDYETIFITWDEFIVAHLDRAYMQYLQELRVLSE
jgi:hypothetical protein